MKLKVMTFNTQHCLNYLEQKIDFDVMARVVNNFAPDIVGFNEMYYDGEAPDFSDQTGTLAEACEIPFHYFGEALREGPYGRYGNGLAARFAPFSVETIKIPSPDDGKYHEPRIVIKARFEGGLTVLVSHFGLSDEEKENAVKTVLSLIEKEKCVLMGDFNMTPDCEILAPIFEAMKDASAAAEGACLSYPSPTPERKIDYIFVSRDIEVARADVPAWIASDHRPHIAELIIH